jgi:tRNA-specific 2-thiouridylase
MFTIGQRKGLPGGSPYPLYVIDIDAENSRVIVGREEDLVREEFEIDNANWHIPDLTEPLEVTVKIRYAHPGAAAIVHPAENGRHRVQLVIPQRAVTPGQAAVLYVGDQVVGGGWIVRQAATIRLHDAVAA